MSRQQGTMTVNGETFIITGVTFNHGRAATKACNVGRFLNSPPSITWSFPSWRLLSVLPHKPTEAMKAVESKLVAIWARYHNRKEQPND